MAPSRRSESINLAVDEKRYWSNTIYHLETRQPYHLAAHHSPGHTETKYNETDCDVTTETVTTKRSDTRLAELVEGGSESGIRRRSIRKYRTIVDQCLPEIPTPKKGEPVCDPIQDGGGKDLSPKGHCCGIQCQDQSIQGIAWNNAWHTVPRLLRSIHSPISSRILQW